MVRSTILYAMNATTPDQTIVVTHAGALDDELADHVVVGADLVRDVVVDALAAQARRREHAGQHRAQYAADGVHAEDIQRVVGAQQPLQPVHAPQADDAREQSEDQRAVDADEAARRA